MFDYIKGILVEALEGTVVLENNGLGYKLEVPSRVLSKLPQVNEALKLYISSVIREDSHRHFGFLTKEERSFFELLIELSGIGPKTALAILGQYEPYELMELATLGDVHRISKVPGIGKKTAERLIVELKGKSLKLAPPQNTPSSKGTHFQDALAALTQLGFSYAHAQKAILSVMEEKGSELDLSLMITASLQKMRG